MTTTQSIKTARTAKAAAVAALEAATAPRASKAACKAIDAAEMDLMFALRAYEMEVRAANPTATEREIQMMARAAR